MSTKPTIRQARPADAPAIEQLYRDAFPEEDLLPLVRDLAASDAVVFVAVVDGALAGHAAFAPCSVDHGPQTVALLGPVAVAPRLQGQGLGSAIIRAGTEHARHAGVAHVYVLGDPAYYGRFGFSQEDNVAPPYPLPEEWREAWQSLRLSDEAPPLQGKLTVPQAWRHEALWLP